MNNPISENGINVLDILKYLLRQWKWYFLSLLIFCGYYYYDYSKSPYVYSKNQTVLIKTANNSNTLSAQRLIRQTYFNTINVNTEILQLKSKQLMGITVKKLNAHINYGVREGLRVNELYKNSPLFVEFLDTLVNEYSKFDVRLLSRTKARIKYIKDDKTVEQTIDVGKVQKTPFGNILVRKTTDTGNLKKYGGKSIK